MPTTTVLMADSRRDLLIHDIRTPLATISGYAQLLLRRAARGGPELLALVEARLGGTSKKLPGAPETCSANSPTCRPNPAHSSASSVDNHMIWCNLRSVSP